MRPFYLHGHERPLTCILFNRDGDLLFSAAKEAILSVYWTSRGERAGTYDCGMGAVSNADCTHDSRYLITSVMDQKVMVFDVETGTPLCKLDETGPCKYVEWCNDPNQQDKFVVVCDNFMENPKAIKLYDYNNGNPMQIWKQGDYGSRCLGACWGPFDQTIISHHENGNIMVWDAFSSQLKDEIEAHEQSVTSLSFSDDCTIMLSTCVDGTAKLWETKTFRNLKTYKTDRPLNAGSISPLYNRKDEHRRSHVMLGGGQEANYVTTSGMEGRFQALIYHMVRGEELGSCKGHFGPINALSFMPNGSGFASGGEDGYVRVYHFDEIYFGDKLK